MLSHEDLEQLRVKNASDFMKTLLSNPTLYHMYETTADQLNEEVEDVMAADSVSFSEALIRGLGYEVPDTKIFKKIE